MTRKLDASILVTHDGGGAVLFDTRTASLWRVKAAALPSVDRLVSPDVNVRPAEDPACPKDVLDQFLAALAARGLLEGSTAVGDPPDHPWLEACDLNDGFFSTVIPTGGELCNG